MSNLSVVRPLRPAGTGLGIASLLQLGLSVTTSDTPGLDTLSHLPSPATSAALKTVGEMLTKYYRNSYLGAGSPGRPLAVLWTLILIAALRHLQLLQAVVIRLVVPGVDTVSSLGASSSPTGAGTLRPLGPGCEGWAGVLITRLADLISSLTLLHRPHIRQDTLSHLELSPTAATEEREGRVNFYQLWSTSLG